MSRTALYKAAIVAGTAALVGGVLWWELAAPAGAPGPAGDEGPGAGESVLLAPSELAGTVLDEEAAKVLFRAVREGKRQVYDPLAYAVLKPDVTQIWPWPEHPRGQVVSRTNNLGFREDADTAVEKSGPRILVAGDSHTDGMVDNAESFANVLEARLAASAPAGAAPVEVLNAGVGNSGPHNYLGTLKRNLYLRPDVFIAVLYTGNDFLNALVLADFFSKRPESRAAGGEAGAYQRQMLAAYERHGATVVDRFNQALKFTRFPADAEIALDAAVGCFREMQALCAAQGIRFVAVLLPTKPDVEQDDREAFLAVLRDTGLEESDYGVNARLGARWAEALRAEGIEVLDTTAALRAAGGGPHYWKKDWHLNVSGHAVVAGLLERAVAPLPGR